MSALQTAGGLPIEAWQSLCAREFADISQAEMAERLTKAAGTRWTAAMVRHMERGKKQISMATARAVCRATGYPWAWFTMVPTEGDVPNVTGRYLSDLDEMLDDLQELVA